MITSVSHPFFIRRVLPRSAKQRAAHAAEVLDKLEEFVCRNVELLRKAVYAQAFDGAAVHHFPIYPDIVV